MESFATQIKKRRSLMIVLTLVALAAVGGTAFYYFAFAAPRYPGDGLRGFTQGMTCGLTAGVAGVLIWQIILLSRALVSEAKLRALYIAETDERNRLINDKVGGLGYNLALWALTVAGGVASFFQPLVAFTLLASMAGMALLKAGLSLYYKNRY